MKQPNTTGTLPSEYNCQHVNGWNVKISMAVTTSKVSNLWHDINKAIRLLRALLSYKHGKPCGSSCMAAFPCDSGWVILLPLSLVPVASTTWAETHFWSFCSKLSLHWDARLQYLLIDQTAVVTAGAGAASFCSAWTEALACCCAVRASWGSLRASSGVRALAILLSTTSINERLNRRSATLFHNDSDKISVSRSEWGEMSASTDDNAQTCTCKTDTNKRHRITTQCAHIAGSEGNGDNRCGHFSCVLQFLVRLTLNLTLTFRHHS